MGALYRYCSRWDARGSKPGVIEGRRRAGAVRCDRVGRGDVDRRPPGHSRHGCRRGNRRTRPLCGTDRSAGGYSRVRRHDGRGPLVLTKRIIPCLDVDGGRVVKGVSFVDLRDAGDPVDLAALYDAEGADEIVFLDITASSDARSTMVDVVERTADRVVIPFTVGGGIRSTEDARLMLRAGAEKVAINSAAVADPSIIRAAAWEFGSQCVVLAIDAKRSGETWEVYTHGGRRATGIDAIEWAKRGVERGAGEILLTSMDADGQQRGYDL